MPRSPLQNGMVERKNRSILNMARSIDTILATKKQSDSNSDVKCATV